MFFIAHRGNINGPEPEKENTWRHIDKAISRGYHVEVDVWCMPDGKLMLGHDKPHESCKVTDLAIPSIWCHAKNAQAFQFLLDAGAHCFFHDKDDYTLTSKKYIWTYPGSKALPSSIYVMPEMKIPRKDKVVEDWVEDVASLIASSTGICSDWIDSLARHIKS